MAINIPAPTFISNLYLSKQITHHKDQKNYPSWKMDKEIETLTKWIDAKDHFANCIKDFETGSNANQAAFNKAVSDKFKAELYAGHVALINKDVIYWRDQANYYKQTRKLLFNKLTEVETELNNIKHGKKD